MNAAEPIAADLGLIRCDVCALVLRAPVVDAAARCPRCGHVLLGAGIFAYTALSVLLTAIHAAGLQGLWDAASRVRS